MLDVFSLSLSLSEVLGGDSRVQTHLWSNSTVFFSSVGGKRHVSAHVLDLKRGETRQEEYALVKFRDANIYGLTVALIFDLLASCYSDTGDGFSDFLS